MPLLCNVAPTYGENSGGLVLVFFFFFFNVPAAVGQKRSFIFALLEIGS